MWYNFLSVFLSYAVLDYFVDRRLCSPCWTNSIPYSLICWSWNETLSSISLWTLLHCVTYWELCIVSRWPSLANWVGFTLPQLAQIDLSCVDVPLNTKQTNKQTNFGYRQCAPNHASTTIQMCCDPQDLPSRLKAVSIETSAMSWRVYISTNLGLYLISLGLHFGKSIASLTLRS